MATDDIKFGTGADTQSGDLFPTAIGRLSGRVTALTSPPSGTGPTTTARIAGTPTTGNTLTATPGVWSGNPTVVGRWARDGVLISPAVTGLTYAWNSATDAGRYISYVETSGGVTSQSNAIFGDPTTVFYKTNFAANDNTVLAGFEGWTLDSNNTTQWLAIVDNDIAVVNTISYLGAYVHSTGSNDYECEFTAYLEPTTTGSNTKYVHVRYTDRDNYIVMNFANNNYVLQSRVAGINANIKAFTNFTFETDVPIKIRVQGDYFRIYYNGAEIPDSVAANNGLGFAIPSALPASSKIAISGVNSSPLPTKFLRSMTISTIAANSLAVSASVDMIDATPGRQRISVIGSKQGTVSQPQALVLSSTGRVVQDWTDLTVTGDNFAGTLLELPQSLEGDNPRIWVRDGVTKLVATSATLLKGVPIQWHASRVDFGLNTTGGMHYGRAMDFVDFTKNMAAGVTSQSLNIFHSAIYADHCAITPPAGSTQYMSAAEMGIENGWPTKVPAGVGAWPSDLKFCLKCTPLGTASNGASNGYSPAQAGTYDITFTPGLDWTYGGGNITISNYNLAAGTAVATVVANSGDGGTGRFIFNSYNGVPNTFPPAGQRVFKMIKRGQDATSAFTVDTINSWKGLTSAAKTDTGYRGCLRFMSNNTINRPYSTIVVEGYTRKPLSENRLGFIERSGVVSIPDMLDACKRARTNLYLNVPDTADPTWVLDAANYLNANMPVGMKVYVEYSNEIAFNFQQGFFQTNALEERSIANGVSNRTQLSRDIKRVVAVPFASVFGIDNPRWNLIVGDGAFRYALNTDAQKDQYVADLLDEGDLYLYARGMCIACYVGNGFGYSDVSPDNGFMSKASRDKAGVDDAGFLNDYFAAQRVMSDWTRANYWNTFANTLARYAVKKGFAVGRFIPVAYEYSFQHSDMKAGNLVSATGSITDSTLIVTVNNNGPIRAGDVLTGTGIITGTKIVAQLTQASGALPGKAGTYSVDTSHSTPTGSITIKSSTNLYAQAAGALMGQTLRDPRAGAAQNYQDAWIRATGGVACHFDHVGGTGNLYAAYGRSGSYWGYADYMGRETIDEPYKSTNADMIANGW